MVLDRVVPIPSSVCVCRPEGLPFVAEGRTWTPGMISVTRPVYASTTVTAVNLDSSRAKDATPQPCFPDICFAVDNFDNAFEDLVSCSSLSQTRSELRITNFRDRSLTNSCDSSRIRMLWTSRCAATLCRARANGSALR